MNYEKPLTHHDDRYNLGHTNPKSIHALGKVAIHDDGFDSLVTINGYNLGRITSRNIHTLGKAALYDDLGYLDAIDQYDRSKPHLSNYFIKKNRVSDISSKEYDLLEWEEDAPQHIVGYAKHVLGIRNIANMRASDIVDVIRKETKVDLDRFKVIDPEYYREKLESLNQKQRELFNKVLNMWSLSDYFEEVKREPKDKNTDYIGLFLEKDSWGNYTMDTESFRQFLRWHNFSHRTVELNFAKRVPELKQSYENRLRELVNNGQLPDNCIGTIRRRIDETPVFLSDGFETLGIGAGGYYDGEKIIVDPTTINNNSKSKTLDHELTHACVEGSELQYSKIDEERYKIMNPNNHSTYSIELEDYSREQFDSHRCIKSAIRALKEGCCEHIAIMTSKSEAPSGYEPEQEMIEFIIRLSKGKLSWDDFIKAFATDSSSEFNYFAEKVTRATGIEDIWLYCGAAFLT